MNSRRDKIKKDMLTGFVGAVVMSFFIFTTNPNSLPVPMLLVLPVILGIVSFSVSRAGINIFFDLNERRTKLISAAIGVGMVLVFAMGSLSQLGLQDIVLALALIGGLSFYIARFNQSY